MTTRSKNNIHKPIRKLTFLSHLPSTAIQEPTFVANALKDAKWRHAMQDEFNALIQNQTWDLVSPQCASNLVGCKWIFRVKRNSNGSISRYKALLVAKGFHQRPGLDYTATFSPVVKPTTVRLVLSIAVSNGWKLRHLQEDVYMVQPPAFVDKERPHFVCKLRKAIYGLKQAPRAWYHELRSFLLANSFTNSVNDTSLFILKHHGHLLYLLVYVDDIIITGDDEHAVDLLVHTLAKRFSLKDLGSLTYFLGVEIQSHPRGLVLSQHRYIQDLLHRTNMSNSRPVATPLPPGPPPTLAMGKLLLDPSEYRATVGNLQYLSLTRPDVSFTVNKLSQFMHKPTEEHWRLVKCLLWYLSGTSTVGLLLHH